MDELDKAILGYVKGTLAKGGGAITQNNYKDIIAYLHEEEKQSYGIIKRTEVIRFLEEWFETKTL